MKSNCDTRITQCCHTSADCTSEFSLEEKSYPCAQYAHDRAVKDKPTSNAHVSADNGGTTYLDKIETTETKKVIEIQKYDYKIVVSGDIIEVYKYSNEQYKTKNLDILIIQEKSKDNHKHIEQDTAQESKDYKRSIETIYATRRRLKNLINANVNQYKPMKDKFITLTFKEELNRDEVIKCFKLFNKRLRYKYSKYEYQYIAVIERGTKNTKRLHMHCLFFGLPYIPVIEFRAIWDYGNVDMKALKNYGDVANYILKYVEKTLRDTTYIPKGKKLYITSMHLKKPINLFLTEELALKYLSIIPNKLIYEKYYNSIYVGNFRYQKLKVQKTTTSNKKLSSSKHNKTNKT